MPELLEENNIPDFLDDKDFVFLMHQGYVFCYFNTDSTDDPDVFCFDEISGTSVNKGALSAYINLYEK